MSCAIRTILQAPCEQRI